jgi:hypothetical protein
MPNFIPSNKWFSCSLIGQQVSVTVGTARIYGQYTLPLAIVKRMEGCSGNSVCKIFPHPSMFLTQGPYKCPYHASLNRG